MKHFFGWALVILLNWIAILFGLACILSRAIAVTALIGGIVSFCYGNWNRSAELAVGALLWLAVSFPCWTMAEWLIEFAATLHPKRATS